MKFAIVGIFVIGLMAGSSAHADLIEKDAPPPELIEKDAPPPEETIIDDEPDGPAAECDCDYEPGGCVISTAAPAGKACKCIYRGAWTCGGEVTSCGAMAKAGFQHLCDKPDKSILACSMGGGDCGGY